MNYWFYAIFGEISQYHAKNSSDSKRKYLYFDETYKGILKIQVAKVEATTFEVRERKTMTRVRESKSKR